MSKSFLELEDVNERILVISVVSATPEKSLIMMKRIKTYNRSIMTRKRQQNLAFRKRIKWKVGITFSMDLHVISKEDYIFLHNFITILISVKKNYSAFYLNFIVLLILIFKVKFMGPPKKIFLDPHRVWYIFLEFVYLVTEIFSYSVAVRIVIYRNNN